ncbi:hypothetical protein KSP39_PZI014031 [Platanthera zijinensis]|uniref:Uncharacterized protein n=1 Tax=Platanthera zijinensis TaxID=2320716 RepID=A0AAP0G426_9ASPA
MRKIIRVPHLPSRIKSGVRVKLAILTFPRKIKIKRGRGSRKTFIIKVILQDEIIAAMQEDRSLGYKDLSRFLLIPIAYYGPTVVGELGGNKPLVGAVAKCEGIREA